MRSSLKMSFTEDAGVLPPTGFWDPLGLAKNIDEATYTKYRTAELKHGRVAQLAVVGYIVQELVRFPGAIGVNSEISFNDIPNGVDALSVLPGGGWFQIGASIGFWELFGWKQVEGSTPGDFGFYNGKELSEDELKTLKTKELQNGRIVSFLILNVSICRLIYS